MLSQFEYHSPLGPMTLLVEADELVGLWFNDQRHFAAQYDLEQIEIQATPQIRTVIDWLDQYFAGQQPDPFAIKLKPQVTEFRSRVLEALQDVPYGTQTTYGSLG